MWGWAASRPRHCLKIGPRGVSWAHLRRDWRGRPHIRSSSSSIPSGLVHSSPVEPNLTDLAALRKRLVPLVGQPPELKFAGRSLLHDIPRPIVLLLPDLSVRTVLLRLDQLPARREERDAVIRWKLGQEQLFPLTNMKVVSSVLPGGGDPERCGAVSVLAAAVQESILAQYESLCDQLRLVPLEIDTVSARLFNLWVDTSGKGRMPLEDFVWVNLADGGLTVLVFQQGALVFLRTKMHVMESGMDVQKTVTECVASIQACKQRHPSLAVKRVVLVTEEPSSELCEAMEEQGSVAVEEWDWSQKSAVRWSQQYGSPHRTALPAVAGLM